MALEWACCLKARPHCMAGYPLKFHFQIPCVFPVRPQIFPVSIYVICDYYVCTKLIQLPPKMEIFAANIEISFTLKTREFTP